MTALLCYVEAIKLSKLLLLLLFYFYFLIINIFIIIMNIIIIIIIIINMLKIKLSTSLSKINKKSEINWTNMIAVESAFNHAYGRFGLVCSMLLVPRVCSSQIYAQFSSTLTRLMSEGPSQHKTWKLWGTIVWL